MKKMLRFLVLAGCSACQYTTPPLVKATDTVAVEAVAQDDELTKRPKVLPADTLPPALGILRQHNLASLWSGHTDHEQDGLSMEGFYGPPHYRISFYFSKVERDPARPNLFHVTGLDRYKKVITPFSGTITVRELRPFTTDMELDVAPADYAAAAYTAVGRFLFKEDPSTKGAGNYEGQALLDFYIDSQQHLQLAGMASGGEQNLTRGAGIVFRGSHVSNKTRQRKQVAFSTQYWVVVPEALSKLGLGDRADEVNPNLAKLGWNEYWENDEWWAESPKPSLSL